MADKSKSTASELVRKPKHGRAGNCCMGLMLAISIVAVVALASIGAVYVTRLQRHIYNLKQRVQVLERQFDNVEQAAVSSDKHQQVYSADLIIPRVKREVRSKETENLESAIHTSGHHGISSHQVALVYGDAGNIVTDNSTEVSHRFTTSTRLPEAYDCGTFYERADGQIWCTPKHKDRTGRYMTSRANNNYSYFKKAAWMNSTKAAQHFELAREGRVVVHRSGLYIVHASVNFRDVSRREFPYYGVYKSDMLGSNRKLISRCTVSENLKHSSNNLNSIPCQAWQLTHLSAGDRVFMNIGEYTWFDIQKDTFHLALIKLNNLEP